MKYIYIYIYITGILVAKLFRVKIGESPVIMNIIFEFKESSYTIRNNLCLKIENVRKVAHGTESLRHLRANLWVMLPDSLMDLLSIKAF